MPGPAHIEVHASVRNPQRWFVSTAVYVTATVIILYNGLRFVPRTHGSALSWTTIAVLGMTIVTVFRWKLGGWLMQRIYGGPFGAAGVMLIEGVAGSTLCVFTAALASSPKLLLYIPVLLTPPAYTLWKQKAALKVSLVTMAAVVTAEAAVILLALRFPLC